MTRRATAGMADRVFRVLLRLLPREFRSAHGAEMTQVFGTARRAAERAGRASVRALWWQTIVGLLRTAPREHFSILRQDTAYALRAMRRNPGFSATVILTIAVGVGVATTAFGTLNALLYKPLPVRAAERLVSLSTMDDHIELPHGLSYPDIHDYATLADVFDGLVGYAEVPAHLSFGGSSERALLTATTGNFFTMLGLAPAAGRFYVQADTGSEADVDVLVLSHDYWRRRLGGDPSIVGSTVRVNGRPFTVVGVAPSSFRGLHTLFDEQAYIPIPALGKLFPDVWKPDAREAHDTRALARLRPGVTLAEARAAVALMSRRLAAAYPQSNDGVSILVVPEPRSRPDPALGPPFRLVAGLFWALVGVLIVLVCANVATLQLSRASSRAHEVAVRSVLGAHPARLVRQLLTESVLLSSAGALAGALLAWWMTAAIVRRMAAYSESVPLSLDFALDLRVLAFMIGLAGVTGVLAGGTPAMRALRRNAADVLKRGGRAAGPGLEGRRLRHALIVVQVALSIALLISGGLFVRSLWNAATMDPGLRPDGVLVLSTDPAMQGYGEARRDAFYRETLARVTVLPGVRSAAWSSFLVFSGSIWVREVFPDGQPAQTAADRRSAMFVSVSPDYLSTVGTTIVAGRSFRPTDDATAPPVAIVNETLAYRLWGPADPVGRRLSLDQPDAPQLEVVGVVRDAKYMFLAEDTRPLVMAPLGQAPPLTATLHVRAVADPAALAPSLRQVLRDLDPDLPVYDVRTLREHMASGNALGPFRLGAELTGLFGVVGLLLAVVGLYGVIAYYVDQRRHEIGVRIALGASAGAIERLVLGQGLRIAVVGVALGWLLAMAVGQPLGVMLLGVDPGDPLVHGIAVATTIGVALAACHLPARRATRVDPLQSLKTE